ncbi:hypothetical protein GQ42DRAFT_153725 [Ramicandelaber brevisporus]|nr:hypothetical protein GQ42DRAFT_153725 [Ramicandelaber brevisporus]
MKPSIITICIVAVTLLFATPFALADCDEEKLKSCVACPQSHLDACKDNTACTCSASMFVLDCYKSEDCKMAHKTEIDAIERNMKTAGCTDNPTCEQSKLDACIEPVNDAISKCNKDQACICTGMKGQKGCVEDNGCQKKFIGSLEVFYKHICEYCKS